MQDVNVVVVFPCRGESIERLALAAAVGAVEGRANIRLRCLEAAPDLEFIAPRDADAEWADAILAVTSPEAEGGVALAGYFDSHPALRELRRMGRAIVVIVAETELAEARLHGQRMADSARLRKP